MHQDGGTACISASLILAAHSGHKKRRAVQNYTPLYNTPFDTVLQSRPAFDAGNTQNFQSIRALPIQPFR